MKWIMNLLCLGTMLTSLGCSDAIDPQEPLITNPSTADFGFEGTWKEIPRPPFEDSEVRVLVITKEEAGIYRIHDQPLTEKIHVVFHAVELGDIAGAAIVEVEASCEEERARFVLVAEKRQDYLRTRFIESKNLPAAMSKEGYSAVIERNSNQRPIVTADPGQLLACIAERYEDLLGPPTVYRRVSD